MDFIKPYSLILASQSPRRQQLLADMGFAFEVRVKNVPEIYPESLAAGEVAECLAILKSQAFQPEELPENYVLVTADTIVLFHNKVLGKPKDRREAIEMLSQLSGCKHEVISGVCLQRKGKKTSFSVKTNVYFRQLTLEEIIYYVDTYKPFDKAGAYGIQEWIGYIGIERVEGSYFNVMGLPTKRLYEELKKLCRN